MARPSNRVPGLHDLSAQLNNARNNLVFWQHRNRADEVAKLILADEARIKEAQARIDKVNAEFAEAPAMIAKLEAEIAALDAEWTKLLNHKEISDLQGTVTKMLALSKQLKDVPEEELRKMFGTQYDNVARLIANP